MTPRLSTNLSCRAVSRRAMLASAVEPALTVVVSLLLAAVWLRVAFPTAAFLKEVGLVGSGTSVFETLTSDFSKVQEQAILLAIICAPMGLIVVGFMHYIGHEKAHSFFFKLAVGLLVIVVIAPNFAA